MTRAQRASSDDVGLGTPGGRLLFVNLPHRKRVQRRWVASYYAPNFLIPPVELMGLATLLRERGGHSVKLVDSIARKLSLEDTIRVGRRFDPDIIVALTGFEILYDDLAMLRELGEALSARTVAFGYLPTRTPERVARHAGIDFVLMGEPEEALLELTERLMRGTDPGELAGLASCTAAGDLVRGPEPERITDLDALPFPDHGLVDLSQYSEAFIPRPIGVITSARGCPYACSFCVRAYGQQVIFRSWQSLADELSSLWDQGIHNVRFLDDTFTLERTRVEKLCEWIQRELPRLGWTCLTRLDRVDPALAKVMARAGCQRVYAGIESGNPDRLRAWGKGLDISQIRAGVQALKTAGIEVSGFFIVGADGEDAEEVRASADFAAELDLDWVIVTQLQQWPGTILFEHSTPEEQSAPRTPAGHRSLYAHERLFYRRFYFRPSWLRGRLQKLFRSPRDWLQSTYQLSRYVTKAAAERDFI